MTGNAAIQAAERARELLTMAVAEKLKLPIENISFAERRAFDVENPKSVFHLPKRWSLRNQSSARLAQSVHTRRRVHQADTKAPGLALRRPTVICSDSGSRC